MSAKNPKSVKSESALYESIKKEYTDHNYSKVKSACEDFIENYPKSSDINEVKIYYGKSFIKLKEYEKGINYLTKEAESSDYINSRADTHYFIAMGYDEWSRYSNYAERIKHYKKASDLYVRDKMNEAAITCQYKLVSLYQNKSYYDDYPDSYEKQYSARDEDVAKTFGKIFSLCPDDECNAKANIEWAQYIKSYSYYDKDKNNHILKLYLENVKKYSDTSYGAQSLYYLGDTYENYINDYVKALETYNKLLKEYPKGSFIDEAKGRIEAITEPTISLNVSGTYKPDSTKPLIKWSTRNVKQIKLTAYMVDLFKVLNTEHSLRNFESIKNLVDEKIISWDFAIPDDGLHKYYSSSNETEDEAKKNNRPFYKSIEVPITKSGAYLIVGNGVNEDNQKFTAYTLIIVSRLGMVTKFGKSNGLAYLVDSITSRPKNDSDVLIQYSYYKNNKYNYTFKEDKPDNNGLLKIDKLITEDASPSMIIISRSGNDYAINNGYYSYWYNTNGNWIYGYTDKPSYRPNSKVYFKQVIYKNDKGEFETLDNKDIKIEVTDSRGEKIFQKSYTTNEFGSIEGELFIKDKAPLGIYYIKTIIDNKEYNYHHNSQGNKFRVEEYKKPEYEVNVSFDKGEYKLGDEITIDIDSKYYFGAPVVDADVEYTIYKEEYHHFILPNKKYSWYYNYESTANRWGWYYPHYSYRHELEKQGKGKTNKEGKLSVKINSKPFANAPDVDVKYSVEAKVVDKSRREIKGDGEIKVTKKSFYINLTPELYIYKPNENVKINVKSTTPNKNPIAFEGTVNIYYVEYDESKDNYGNKIFKEKLGALALNDTIKIGDKGEGIYKWTSNKEGYFKIIINSKDKWGEEIEGSCYFWISDKMRHYDKYKYGDIEIITDKDTYKVGDKAKILINTKYTGMNVLLTAEVDDIYKTDIINVEGNSVMIEYPITKSFQPNVFLSALAFKDDKLYQDRVEVIVPPEDKFITVEVKTPKTNFQPQEEAEIVLVAKDASGKPVQAELSVGFIDESVYYIQEEFRENIQKFFYGNKRYYNIRTNSNYDYSHYGWGRKGKKRETGNLRGGVKEWSANIDGEPVAEGEEVSADAPPSPSQDAKPVTAKAKPAGKDEFKKINEVPKDPAPEVKYKDPKVRKDFRDAIFWTPSIKTDASGNATVKVKFPDSLTSWRITTTAVTKDTQVGAVTKNVITKKNLLVRLQSPRFFLEKDLVYISGNIHNYLDSQKDCKYNLKVSDELSITEVISQGEKGKPVRKAGEYTGNISVDKNGEARIDFVVKVNKKGQAKVYLECLTNEESDAMEMTFPVYEYGASRFVAYNTILDAKKGPATETFEIDIPKEIKEKSQSLKVSINPSLANIMIEALPYLISYPYGCTEQTMSRFLPTVVVKKALTKLGISLESIKSKLPKKLRYLKDSPIYDTSEMNKMIEEGLNRLYDFQQSDGGWGWWKNDTSSPYMTAYVLYGLTEAKNADIKVDSGKIDSAIQFLLKIIEDQRKLSYYSDEKGELNTITYLLYVLSMQEKRYFDSKGITKYLNKVFEERDNLNDYSKALLSLTYANIGQNKKASLILDNMEDFIQIDKELKTVSFQFKENGYWYWYQNPIETTTMALRAYLKLKPDSEYIPMMVKWLVRSRQGSQWYSTKDTAFCIFALSEYMVAENELEPNLNVSISFGDSFQKSYEITKKDVLTMDTIIDIPQEMLGSAKSPLTVSIKGKGKLYTSAYLDYFTKEDTIKESRSEVGVKRTYYKLTKQITTEDRRIYDDGKKYDEKYQDIKYNRSELKFGDVLTSGDEIEVQLDIKADNAFEYVIFEDPKPAGCEPLQLVSGGNYQGGFCSNLELRDEKVAFFVTYLPEGKHVLTYRLRCEIPGRFNVMPSQSMAMYSPYVRANSSNFKIGIDDKK